MHHIDISIQIDQLDVTCFIISLFTDQHVSNVSASIFRSLRLTVDLFHVLYCSGSMCVGVTVWFGWGGVVWCGILIEPEQYNPWNKSTISRKLLKTKVLTFETCWAENIKIIKQVTSSWSIFIQLFFGDLTPCRLVITDVSGHHVVPVFSFCLTRYFGADMLLLNVDKKPIYDA